MTDPNKTPPAGEPGKANSTVMVVVGCKLPNGMICEMGKPGDDNYTRVVLNGSNANKILGADGNKVVGGYGLTPVSKDFWEAWTKKNQRLDFVRKGLVFQHANEASARDHAKDMAGNKNGLEPLNPAVPLPGTLDRSGKPLVEVDAEHAMAVKRAAMGAR